MGSSAPDTFPNISDYALVSASSVEVEKGLLHLQKLASHHRLASQRVEHDRSSSFTTSHFLLVESITMAGVGSGPDSADNIPPEIPSMANKKADENQAETSVEVAALNDTNGSEDFDKLTVDEALRRLECSDQGLTSSEAEIRLQKYGPNKLEESKKNPIIAYLLFFWNPLSWCMEVAAIIGTCVCSLALWLM